MKTKTKEINIMKKILPKKRIIASIAVLGLNRKRHKGIVRRVVRRKAVKELRNGIREARTAT